jgi:ubiquinone biosynthesis protein COQ4
MIKTVNELMFGRAFYRLTLDPTRTEEVFRLSDIGLKLGVNPGLERTLAKVRADRGYSELRARNYRAPEADLSHLRALADGTVGREYARHLDSNGLDPVFYPERKLTTELDYIIMRGREVHDIWHVLAGYGTSVIDELALQAFTLAQLDSQISGVVLASGIMHFTRFDSGRLGEVLERIEEGHARGRDSGCLIGVAWEERWEMPLEEARSWMTIPGPFPSGTSNRNASGVSHRMHA